MKTKHTEQQISRDAAMLAVEWKARFARELQDAACRVAQDAAIVTSEHYHQALPHAIAALVQQTELETTPLNAREETASQRAA
ncbi:MULTISPECIES: hypothetical protein [Pirellulaceae]|uniref:Uncharacterized protein n=2 Tax=Aporhodopirellula TaxID=3028534 RepID=A0A7W5E293_9BACT|nr:MULTISPECIES: hypothetical protein [Pirellulaceae]MBB3208467.1 hypothetical protein [Aporhodopirellula rubra]MCM2369629.1 hypothetical protein [Aporhodopirellula aestuarii]